MRNSGCLTAVCKLTTSGAPHVAWGHKADDEGLVPTTRTSGDVGRVKIRRVVLIQHLALRHLEALCMPIIYVLCFVMVSCDKRLKCTQQRECTASPG